LRRFTNDTGDETIASTEHDKKKIGINRCTLKLLNRDQANNRQSRSASASQSRSAILCRTRAL
jgi:hypothetical protein